MPNLKNPLFAIVLMSGLAFAAVAFATPEKVVELEDPAGDGNGPGTYSPPLYGEFVSGDFDLRRFAVLIDGNDAIFEVTLGAAIRRPDVTQRTNTSELSLTNGIYLQNIDIYLDTDRAPGSGYTNCIPGRRIGFAPGQSWEMAVVLTPQPGPARALVTEAFGAAVASHVLFVQPVESAGRTLIARVPLTSLGGRPSKSWGYSVQLSGASWERNFYAARHVLGSAEVNVFTMDVTTVPDQYVFGGAPEGSAHPRVIDVILPAGMEQKTVLGSFDEKTGTLARIPFVYPEPPPAAPNVDLAMHPVPSWNGPVIADVNGELVSLSHVPADVRKLQFGRIVDANGATVGHVMVMNRMDDAAVTQIVDGKEHAVAGAHVLFDGPRH